MRTESWSASSSKSAWGEPLPRAFYGRDTRQVARDLLGKVLVVRAPRPRAGLPRELAARIVETEAYRGDDPASHSARGPTPRSAIMFGPPGVAYVYFIYGMHEMLNFVTERDGFPGAVLVRGAALIGARAAAAGPGRLTRALGIRMRDNGQSLLGPRLSVHEGDGPAARVMASPRIGIRAGRERLWRYFLEGERGVSRAAENAVARPWKGEE